ncbi:MAG: DUF1552 domain-containing protein [Planctomycetes bacterium]|nr:DUF1552 domain-containing protein [Planctomycetota bacterium]
MSAAFHRRAFLRGAGVALALPWLESLAPRGAAAAPAGGPPRRLVFVYVPNGVHLPAWTPKTEGTFGALPPTLAPLAPFAARLTVVSGLAQQKAEANGDGPGDHARAAATFLTGAQARKAAGEIRAGRSIDQAVAAEIGAATPFPSLELGCDPSAVAGECDSGYSCAYSSTVAWRTATTPLPKETDPRALFDRLFTDAGGPGTPQEKALRRRRRRRVLDVVADEARALAARLGATDRRKLDEYLTGVEELEARLDRAGEGGAVAGLSRPGEAPRDDLATHAGLLLAVLATALRTDRTRVATVMLANEGSGRSYPSIGVPEGHHGLSHHAGDAAVQEKLGKIDRYHVEILARFLAALDAVPEGDGTLLSSTHVVYGSGIGDGNRHNHDELPILHVGAPLPGLRAGEHVRHPRRTPLGNLFASLGVAMTGRPLLVGDATGPL